ncbi:MAG: hypothetical protein QM788_15685 [Roseateles sp.]|uniref:hypothetical protein n=1 Tax=Roseateles sp. TaxID=1971397 RepID=UPI0039ED68EB
MKTSTRRSLATSLLAVVALIACGGGNEVEKPASFELLPDDLAGAPCARCRSGHLVGMAADGAPLADAEVLVVDARGLTAHARTAADGRYDVATEALSGPLLVQVRGTSSGEPVMLHSLAVPLDVGQRAVNVTPLTELMTAFVLGGTPHELLQDERVDFMRVNAAALRSSLDRVKQLVRPVLALLGAEALDPRTGEFEARHAGLDGVAGLLDLQPRPAAYALRTAGPDMAPITVDPVASSSDAVLPPLSAAEQEAARAALAAVPEIERQLGELQARFASGIPAAADLLPLLDAGFRHTGLAGAAFAERVLRRHDADELGGFSLQGAHFGAVRVLQAASGDRLLVRFQVRPRAPWLPHAETLWMRKSGGRWLWQGDGQAGQVRVRHVAVLGPRAAAGSALRALPGMRCEAVADAAGPQCRIDGGQADVPAGGLLDYGSPDDTQFGLFAAYRSDAATWQARLEAARLHSRALGTPSAQVTRLLAFEVDARRIDPRAQRVRVTGPGLPPQGLDLAAPAPDGDDALLSFADRPGADAHQVPLGHCPSTGDADREACRQAWAALRAGTPYDFAFLAADGTPLQVLTARLPSAPPGEASLAAQRERLFTRFDLASAPEQQPLYARVVDPALAGRRLQAAWPWRAAAAATLTPLGASAELQLAHPASGETRLRRVRRLPAQTVRADGSAVWDVDLEVPAGWLPVWLSARLTSADALGSHFVHYIAPNNPY